MAKGNIILHLTIPLQQFAENIATAEDMWTQLFECYRAVSVPSIYKDFKEVISLCFHANQHAGPLFDQLDATFACLGAITFGTTPNVTNLHLAGQYQMLIAMATLLTKWEMLIPIICQGEDLEDLNLAIVRQVVIAQYETEVNRGQQPHRQCGSRGSGQNRKDKGKGKGKQTQGHSHVASVAALDSPTTHIASDISLPSQQHILLHTSVCWVLLLVL